MSIFDELKKPMPSSSIHWRVGSTTQDKAKGMALAYLDARDVMERLDNVCGPENWQTEYPWSDGKKLPCRIGVKLDGEWVWKANGAGDTAVEADKGAFSDAFKRTAVLFGVGRDLYSLPNWWMPLVPAGKSYKFGDDSIFELNKKYEQWLKGEAKPEYTQEEFEKQKFLMKEKIDSGERTTSAIISNVRTNFIVSKEMAQQITNLGNGTEGTPEY